MANKRKTTSKATAAKVAQKIAAAPKPTTPVQTQLSNSFKPLAPSYSKLKPWGPARKKTPSTPPPVANTGNSVSGVSPEMQLYNLQKEREQRQIAETIKAVFSQYGLASLNSLIEQYARQDMSGAAIEIALRQTPEYKQRFPAMEALVAKKRAITEAEYIDYERTASALERQYGLPQDMLMGRVTDLLTNEVSMSELNDRVVLAASAAIQAPQDFRQTMSQYYNIDTGGLTAYFLDPTVATPLLEKQFASSVIGTEARRQGIGIDVYGAENLQELGISREQARVGFGQVARAQPLTEGRGDIVSQEQLIGGTFGATEEAQRAVERARQARVGRFAEGGGMTGTSQGVTGLGTATTG